MNAVFETVTTLPGNFPQWFTVPSAFVTVMTVSTEYKTTG